MINRVIQIQGGGALGVQAIQTIATVVIALLAASIASGQWWTARQKLVLDLFEKRFQVFMDLRTLASEALQLGKVTNPASINEVLARSQFLFDSDINTPLKEIHNLLGELEMGRSVGPEVARKFEQMLPLFQSYLGMHQKLPALRVLRSRRAP